MINNTIHVAYTLTDDISLFQMAMVSIHSLLVNNNESNLIIHVGFDTELNKNYVEKLKAFEKYDNCLAIDLIKIDGNSPSIQYVKNLVNFIEPIYLFELLDKINCDKVIYVSSLTLITNSLRDMYENMPSDKSTYAAEYIFRNEIPDLKRDFIFNCSLMLINVNLWKKYEYIKKLENPILISSLKNNPLSSSIRLFNFVIEDCQLIDFNNNYVESWCADSIQLSCTDKTSESYKNIKARIEEPYVVTFYGPLPNDKKCKNSYVSQWWKYAEQTSIYEELKLYRQANKYKLQATTADNSFNYFWLLSRIWPYIKPYWFRILLGFLISIPMGLLDGVTAFALKPYMDYVVAAKDFVFDWHFIHILITSMQMAVLIPVAVIVFAIIQGVIRYLEGYITSWNSAHITNNVKFALFHRLVHMHPQFFDENSSGIVISRYIGDPGAASSGVVSNIQDITVASCGALGLIAVMLYSSWKLAFIGVLVLCIAFVPVILIRNKIKETSNKGMVIGGQITTNINETYSGNKVMAAYELQDRQENYFREKVIEGYNIGMSLYKRSGWMSPMMYLIASCGIATVLGYGTYLITSGQMTAGSFASFVTSLLLLYKPVKTLGNTFTGFQGTFVAMGRIFELFDLEPEINDCENPKELTQFNKEVKFENVDFEYETGKPILKNINLTIPKNETLAIVGNSGGGKSTLVNLLPRFYDIKSGSIKFDGVDIREFSLKSLRRNISMVFQDNFLYTGTIKENIMMGNPSATAEELENAIKYAHLEEMIANLPKGLETELGERGLSLSGGQRQRVAIARAMLRNAPIVILDEATSALDNESEAIVQKAMDNLMQNRTVFIIAHRLSTIKNADRIAVVNEGELVELGTHDELMQIEDGNYKTLYEMQFKNQEN